MSIKTMDQQNNITGSPPEPIDFEIGKEKPKIHFESKLPLKRMTKNDFMLAKKKTIN